MNQELQDELTSINAIYGKGTLNVISPVDPYIVALSLPGDSGVTLRLCVPASYPAEPPVVQCTVSVGENVHKGQGAEIVALAQRILKNVWAGSPCIFDLLDEMQSQSSAGLELEQSDADDKEQTCADDSCDTVAPRWSTSDTTVERKSIFVARVAPVSSVAEAKAFVKHLLSTDKKTARATHNISAWRIRSVDQTVSFQDCDDDGETAAGGRLLHLLQLTDACNVLVVVTRWFGGVHLGPQRFKIINTVAREALVRGGFVDGATTK